MKDINYSWEMGSAAGDKKRELGGGDGKGVLLGVGYKRRVIEVKDGDKAEVLGGGGEGVGDGSKALVVYRWPPQPKLSNFLHALYKNKGQVLLTAYDENVVGRVHVLAYRDEMFMDYLDALTDNVDGAEPMKKIPPRGEMVVARMGTDPDPRDERSSVLEALGGIHNKPWRAIVAARLSQMQCKVTFFDLGVTQVVPLKDIYLPSEAVMKYPKDYFGGWVQLRETKMAEGEREFYLHTYCELMEPFVFNFVVVSNFKICDPHDQPHMELTMKILTKGIPRNVGCLIMELNDWEYARIILQSREPMLETTKMMSLIHGPMMRIFLKDIVRDTQALKKVYLTPNLDRIQDDWKVWNGHIENYIRHVLFSHDWIPMLNEVFLIYGGDKKIKMQKRWRRVCRIFQNIIVDLDEPDFFVHFDSENPLKLVVQAPKELLNRPLWDILYPERANHVQAED